MSSNGNVQLPTAHRPSVIEVASLSKDYHLYGRPSDRLKHLMPTPVRRLLRVAPPERFRALDEVSFEVFKGETVGIIGRNGSGKSTLLQIVCGTLTPSAGHARVCGRVAALLELGSGFNPEFTGRDNVALNAALLGLSAVQLAERMHLIEAFADIGEFINQPVKTYSSGMLVRLAFAVIAHVDADILVIDEALAVGDAFFTQKCMRYLRKFMERGTVLFVSHDTSAVRALCDRCIWMDGGRVRLEGPAKDVCESYLEHYFEESGSKPAAPRLAPATVARPLRKRDARADFIDRSTLRNDLQVFDFDPDSPSFGAGGAAIEHVSLCGPDGRPLAWICGGEPVRLSIDVRATAALESPIVGFYVKDRLGQTLFGDNTYLSFCENPVRCPAGALLHAGFDFQMPRLPVGDYVVTAAVADGTQNEHVMHHWIHDGLKFTAVSSSVAAGIVGIPMERIALELAPSDLVGLTSTNIR